MNKLSIYSPPSEQGSGFSNNSRFSNFKSLSPFQGRQSNLSSMTGGMSKGIMRGSQMSSFSGGSSFMGPAGGQNMGTIGDLDSIIELEDGFDEGLGKSIKLDSITI